MRTIIAIFVSGALITAAMAQSAETSGDDAAKFLPPKDGAKLSEIIARTETRPGFHAIKSIEYSQGEYEVRYFMNDGAEVRLNYDAKTGQPKPPRGGGLFGG